MAKRAESRYVISADDRTRQGTMSAENNFRNLQKGVTSFATASVAAGNIIAKAFDKGWDAAKRLAMAIPELSKELDNIGKSAKDVGTGVDEFLAIQHSMDLIGVSAEKTTKVVEKMQDAIGEAAFGNKEYTDSFKAIGLELSDVQGKGTAEQMLRVIGALQHTFNRGGRDAATRSRRRIFGRGTGRIQQAGAGAFLGGIGEFSSLSGPGVGAAVPAGERAQDESARFDVAARALRVELGEPFVNAWGDLLKTTTAQLVGLRQFVQSNEGGLVITDRTPQSEIPEFRGRGPTFDR